MAGTSPHRTETRTPLKLFVELYSFDNATFEITSTLDVSWHGARVLTDAPWAPDQRLLVRMVGGQLNSRARVAYCRSHASEKYVVGLEIHDPSQYWPTFAQTSSSPSIST